MMKMEFIILQDFTGLFNICLSGTNVILDDSDEKVAKFKLILYFWAVYIIVEEFEK